MGPPEFLQRRIARLPKNNQDQGLIHLRREDGFFLPVKFPTTKGKTWAQSRTCGAGFAGKSRPEPYIHLFLLFKA
jgi:hypothetical protein